MERPDVSVTFSCIFYSFLLVRFPAGIMIFTCHFCCTNLASQNRNSLLPEHSVLLECWGMNYSYSSTVTVTVTLRPSACMRHQYTSGLNIGSSKDDILLVLLLE
jgi:hypothetical protein